MEIQKEGEELITIKGLVIPVEWDEEGRVVAAAIFTYNEEEYLVDNDYKGRELMPLIYEGVEVSGVVGEKGGRKKIIIKEFRLRKGPS